MNYGKLQAHDAAGKQLPSKMELCRVGTAHHSEEGGSDELVGSAHPTQLDVKRASTRGHGGYACLHIGEGLISLHGRRIVPCIR